MERTDIVAQGANSKRSKLLEPAQEQAEVVAGSGEHGVDAIAIAAGEIVAAHAVILLEVADDGFDGGAPAHLAADGRRETLEGAGKPLADQYRAQGLEMLHEHAQFEDGSVSVEAGIADMLIRMEGGRFKVLKHLNEWFEEFRLYHRKDGRVHKEGDDLMSATRYAVMMLRYAATSLPRRAYRRRDEGSWLTM